MKGSITPMIRNRRILVTALAAGLVLLTSIPGRSDSGGIPNENAKGYWTQDRMANAIAIELVVDEKTGIGKIQPAAARKGGSTSTSTSISTSDWPQNAPIAQTAVGKVFFSDGISDYVCSGALVQESNIDRAIVLTAGHCVWDQVKQVYYQKWVFVPNYDSNTKNPAYPASKLVVQKEFADQGSFNSIALRNDWAFAILPDSDAIKSQGAYPLVFTSYAPNELSVAYGYPQAKPFNGLTLKYAAAPIFFDSKNANTTIGMSSSMTGGASGGPWVRSSECTKALLTNTALCYGQSGSIASLNSYKYGNDNSKMYGPIFNSSTSATFELAKTS